MKVNEKKQKTVNELCDQITSEYEVFLENNNKFVEKGNKTAARRARTATNSMGKLLKEYRKVSNEITK